MSARRVSEENLVASGEEISPGSQIQGEFQFPVPNTIDGAAEAADEMAAKSAVLVEMMEDLEEQLRRRMANLNDPNSVYVRKVKRFQSLTHSEGDALASVAASRRSTDITKSDGARSRL